MPWKSKAFHGFFVCGKPNLGGDAHERAQLGLHKIDL